MRSLERSGRFEQAARTAERLGAWSEASRLWERACHFQNAALAALCGGDPLRAATCAAISGVPNVIDAAVAAFGEDPSIARHAAAELSSRGRTLIAGRILERIGAHGEAAERFEKSGDYLRAALAHRTAGAARQAARSFEIHLRQTPDDHEARLELGTLLLEHGQPEPAVKALQKIPQDAAERLAALRLLHPAFVRLGLDEAAREVKKELEERGGSIEDAPPAAIAGGVRGELLFGRYEVLRALAPTASARVYETLDRISGARMAVKVFAASRFEEAGRDALHRFEREARALALVDHPKIVRLVEYLPAGPAVVLPWMGGGSLADALGRAPLSPARAVEIADAVLQALSEAHRRGILHRDIKPANVLFDEAGAPHLGDFGSSHINDAAATVTEGVLGTLSYMAPEQRRGAPANLGSDIYGVGALLWHMLTGAPPGGPAEFLSDELGPAHHAIASRLVAPRNGRPADTASARALLRSVSWPRTVPNRRPSSQSPSSSVHAERLIPLGADRYRDVWLDREVRVLPATTENLRRALPYAQVHHPGLPAVLAHKPVEGELWVEHVVGEPLKGPLGLADRKELEDALAELHNAGGVHGCIDRQHLVVRNGHAVLQFGSGTETATPSADIDALERLCAPDELG